MYTPLTLYLLIAIFIEDMENKVIINKINAKWLKWFVGFNDAEGNFQVYPKKRVLKSGEISKYNVGYAYHLSLHQRDTEILKNIKDKLNNVGTIYEYMNKPDSRLAVNDKAGLLSIIHNVFDVFPLVTKNQLIRYLLLKDGLVNNVKEFKTLEEYNHYKTERLLSIGTNLSSLREGTRDNELKYRVERLLKAPYDIDN